MGQRIPKVESLVQQTVAGELRRVLERDSGRVTVTRVDVSPDIRHAIVWLGIIGEPQPIFDRLKRGLHEIQAGVASKMETKFIPRVEFKHDTGGAHSAEIERLLRT